MEHDARHPEREIAQLLARLSTVRRQQKVLAKEEVEINDALIQARAMLRALNEESGQAEAISELPSFVFSVRAGNQGRGSRPKNPDRGIVVAAVSEILIEAGRPLSVEELYDALLSRGIEIRGRRPEVVLTTMLWRSRDRIDRVGNTGYWLVSA
ncbi:hypothetical protein [Croceibacterium ferulae]|uniref:hypothetical protein n=1 Tax=Croceibacterium ferulae TaxID=1854641 RepID=UPI000F8873C5|nr:hypothetical protein [Croceibacterium ferulae]